MASEPHSKPNPWEPTMSYDPGREDVVEAFTDEEGFCDVEHRIDNVWSMLEYVYAQRDEARTELARLKTQDSTMAELATLRGVGQEVTPFEGHNCHGCKHNITGNACAIIEGYVHDKATSAVEAVHSWTTSTVFHNTGMPRRGKRQTQTKGCPGFEVKS